jgi:ATP-binding cassette, subfamily B, bacterial MsbA
VFVFILALISWKLTVIALLAASLISWVLRLATRSAAPFGLSHSTAEKEFDGRILEGLSGMKEVRIFGREKYEERRFFDVADRLRKVGWKLTVIRGVPLPLYEFLAVALLLSVLMISGTRDPGNLGASFVYVFLLFRLQPSLASFERFRVQISSLEGDFRVLQALMEEMPPQEFSADSKPFPGLRHSIELRNVSYHYDPEASPALKSVSFIIPSGTTTALVGPSGAGKTTLVNLLLGLRRATSGQILVDGENLDTVEISSWRSRLSLVTQNAYIFNSTIRDNIAYGLEGASEEQIVQAAERANAFEFIKQLPRSLDTIIGSRGILLSDGQRQRIALARALVREPQILILDEATNAMDSISEHVVMESLRQLNGTMTIIIIAHRLSTIEYANRIVVLEQGRLREEGTTEQLRQMDGLFSNLYKQQNSAQERE